MAGLLSAHVPISSRIANGVVLLESAETATFTEWCEAFKGFLADPDYRPSMGVIHDWRRLLTAPPSTEIMARAEYVTEIPAMKGTRWALIVAGTAAYGMGRMAEILMETSSVELRVFRDMAEAEAWVRGG